jgi:hypothetical protein
MFYKETIYNYPIFAYKKPLKKVQLFYNDTILIYQL